MQTTYLAPANMMIQTLDGCLDHDIVQLDIKSGPTPRQPAVPGKVDKRCGFAERSNHSELVGPPIGGHFVFGIRLAG